MARPLRVEFTGACYHVLNRGNYRRALFSGEGAAAAFEPTQGEAAVRFGCAGSRADAAGRTYYARDIGAVRGQKLRRALAMRRIGFHPAILRQRRATRHGLDRYRAVRSAQSSAPSVSSVFKLPVRWLRPQPR